ncbi:MAG TPA: hypothetical protein ENL16_01045 [Candidatus Woesearchaeota archaeon]|nr:hypothetical protein [Candidatus Woesearchaeota archaeon]
MEIRIDTKKDSPEDIRKTIEFLQRLIENSTTRDDFNTSNAVSTGMSSLFGDTPVLRSSPGNDDERKDNEEKQNIEIIPY